MKEIFVTTQNREELVDITSLIQKNIDIKIGIMHAFVPHATAGITINENADPNIPKDICNCLRKLVPQGKWMHDKVDGNGDAHIKTALVGNFVFVPVNGGKLQLGRWQDIFLCEFDGPRKRKIVLNFIPLKT